jgi:uncharacterized membrane protein
MELNSSQNKKYKILLILFAIGLIASIILYSPYLNDLCGGNNSGCDAVANSGYKQTFGIENSLLGIIAFTILGALSLSQILTPHKKKDFLLKVGIIIISLSGAYFIFLQLVVIKAICRYCMIVDITSIVALMIYIFYKR